MKQFRVGFSEKLRNFYRTAEAIKGEIKNFKYVVSLDGFEKGTHINKMVIM